MQELRGSGLFNQQDADLSQFVHEYSTRKAQGALVAAINEQRDIIFDGTTLTAATLVPLFCSKVSVYTPKVHYGAAALQFTPYATVWTIQPHQHTFLQAHALGSLLFYRR